MIVRNRGVKAFLSVALILLSSGPVFSQPNTIPNLLLWLSADTNIVEDGFGNVSHWNDKSGNGNDFVQDSFPLQPQKLFSDMFRADAMHFDGNMKSLVDSSILSVSNFAMERTTMIIFWGLNGSVPQYGVVATKDGSGYWRFIGDGSGYFQNFRNVRLEGYPATMPTSGIHISSLVVTDSNYEFFMDGSSMGIRPSDWGIGNNFYIGRDESHNYLNGEIVELLIYNDSLSSTQRLQVEQYLHDKYAPPVSLGNDILMSDFCDTVIDAGVRYKSYHWSTGDTTQSITVNSSGIYYVDVVDIFGASSSDTITVVYPDINELPLNGRVCLYDSVFWNTNLDSTLYTFNWSTGDTTSSIYIANAGSYWVTVTDLLGCSRTSDTITMLVDSFPATASLGNDSIWLCVGNTIGLVQGYSQAATYSWSTSETTSTIHVFIDGEYLLNVIDSNGCMKTDSIYATIVGFPPVANFFADSICEGAFTQFTDSSYDPTSGNSVVSWHWDFGDGFTDTVVNPAHTFASAGNHPVILTVTSNYGCPDQDTEFVAVHSLPVASFINTNPCQNIAVLFNSTTTIDSSSSISGYQWNFGDPSSGGNNSSILQNPSHLYANSGIPVVSLITTSNFGCSDTAVQVLTVNQSIQPHFVGSPTCYGNIMQFTNFSTNASIDSTWQWNFGDLSSPNPLENPSHLYGFAQTYTVTLTAYAFHGCITSASSTVTVSPLPTAAFVHSPACVGVPYQFMDSSYIFSGNITGWEWHFTSTDSSFDQNPFFTFPDTGNYLISLKVTSNIGAGVGCSGSITRSIHVNPLPVANFSFTPQYGNPPLTVAFTNLTNNINANTYEWNFGDNGVSTLSSPLHLYSDTNLFAIQLIATSQYGCKDTVQKNIYIIKPVLDLAITGLTSTYISNNHLHIIVDLANLGTRPINKFRIVSRLAEGTPVEQSFEQVLPNGYSGQIELSSSLDLGSGLAKYYCVSGVKPNDVDDDNLLNNEVCKNLSDEFIVVNPYPNPFNDRLFFQLILPYKDHISIDIFDIAGKKITVYDGEGKEGSNLFEAELGDLSNGTYSVRFKFRDSEVTKQIVKAERKN
jgi:PKD repeat protein